MFKIIYELCLQLVYVGVAYTTLDWFRHQKADFSAPKQMFSAFKPKIWFNIVMINILTDV
ncbi:hypothetical protein [Ligilactobacillus sp. WC1T17]|uniref:hypothetical protein n=1 Tax=Ligilactobacillus sp. WC1T17 TaxID=3158786 RepID=UPI00094C6084